MARRRGRLRPPVGNPPADPACALADSPARLAAWIAEKFTAWSDCAGEVERRSTKDELLTTITLYWVTGTIGSSFLFYHDSQHDPRPRPRRVKVPVGVALFPKENPVTGPRESAEASYNITRWTQMPAAGTSRPPKSRNCSPVSCERSSAR